MPQREREYFKKIGIAIALIVVTAPAAFADIKDSVVKVFVASNSVDYYHPWQSKGVEITGGSGVIIDGNKILTNAHVVADQTFIQVKKNTDAKKYTAKVEVVGHDCDLALLSVDDPQFSKGVQSVKFGDLPVMQDAVTVIGYPEGGDKISITEGVVSRIEVTSYAESARQLLTVQIDAAINPGNSGGPVILDGKVVGIAMQTLQQSQNIGYMIPVPIIEHFLTDWKDGKYQGFPLLGMEYNTTENKALRQHYKIENQTGGVIVTKILPGSAAENYLKEEDVVLAIDGVEIGEDATFAFRGKERLELPYLITRKQIGEPIKFKIARDGKVQELSFAMSDFKTLVSYPYYYKQPPYYIYGGLVFTVLSTDLLKSWGQRWWEKVPLDFAYYLIGAGRLNNDRREDIVVLLHVLADDINAGYHGYEHHIIKSVNGKVVNSFKDFVIELNKAKHGSPATFIETEQNIKIIIKNENIDAIDAAILDRNSIPYASSEDVVQWIKEQ